MPLTKIQSLGITDGTIVNADINASAAITLAKLTGVNDAKAWVNFNGTGTVAIRGSFNVSSITDNGAGDYTVNFTTSISDANYASVCSAGTTGTADAGRGLVTANANATGSCRVNSKNANTGTLEDFNVISFSVFR